MKREVAEAFERMQESVRDVGSYGGTVEMDIDDAHVILQWAEKKGLAPDYQVGDRVMLTAHKKQIHYGYVLLDGALGTVDMLDHSGTKGDIRVEWDDDPLEEKEPRWVLLKDIKRVY